MPPLTRTTPRMRDKAAWTFGSSGLLWPIYHSEQTFLTTDHHSVLAQVRGVGSQLVWIYVFSISSSNLLYSRRSNAMLRLI